MASRTYQVITSDLSGEDGAETYSFTWNGVPLQIDLTDVEGKEFEELMAPYVASARHERGVPNNPTRRSRAKSGVVGGEYDTSAVRAWATENGFEVAPRGRIPSRVVEAYLQAH